MLNVSFSALVDAGYVTTNARYITLVEDSIAPEKEQLQKARDGEVCTLMVRQKKAPSCARLMHSLIFLSSKTIPQANVHKLYTESLMNPFTPLGPKIKSKRFDAGVAGYVHAFNSKG